MTEKELQRRVLRMAKEFGWRVFHPKAAPTRGRGGRYLTHFDGDAGFPDCVFVRDGRILFVELKAEKGQISDGQSGWLHELRLVERRCGYVRVEVWRPQDWDSGLVGGMLQ